MKMMHIIRNEVGQVSIFGMIPDYLDWIQIRRISWQPLHLEPVRMLSLQQPYGLAVGAEAIHHDDELAPHKVMEQGQESEDFLPAHVALMDLENKPDPTSQGGYRERRDNRESVMTVPTVLDGCLPLGRLAAAYDRLEHKAAFVEKDDAPSMSAGFFLSEASAR
jgi:hypothetical protein